MNFDQNTVPDLLLQGRYRLSKLLARGAVSKTFLAVDELSSPPIPCIVKQFWLGNATGEVLAKAQALFQQAAISLTELGAHPQIPALLAACEQYDCFYLVQEFIEGTNLAQVLVAEGTFREVQIWQLLAEVLPVLSFAHQRQVLHRDIKPENIIRASGDNQLVLVDWGTPQLMVESNVVLSLNSGSAEYTAPEQAQGKAVVASDLYSLGVTCIRLLTQVSPFDLFDGADDCWVWRQYLPTPVSDRLAIILNKLLENDPNRRYQSAAAVQMALPQRLQPPTSPPVSPWECTQVLTINDGIPASVNAVAFSPNGQFLVSGGDDKIVRLWDVNAGRSLSAVQEHSDAINAIAFSPDGKIIASASSDRTIILWEVTSQQTLQAIATFTGHQRAVKSLAFSPNGELLASGSWDKTIKLWHIPQQREVATLVGHTLQVTAVAFSPDGKFLASASFDRTARLWNLQDLKLNQESVSVDNSPKLKTIRIFSGHLWPVFAVAFSLDGQILATGGDDRTVQLWNSETGQATRALLGHSWSVVALAFSPDGKILISSSWDKTIKLWEWSTGQEICTLAGHSDSVCAASVVATDTKAWAIASASKDKTIRLWQPVPKLS